MKQEIFLKTEKLSDIENFPFKSFEEIVQKDESKQISIGTSMDTARKWVANGATSPHSSRRIINAFQYLYILLPLAGIIGAIVTSHFFYMVLAPLAFVTFMLFRPITVRALPSLKIIIWFSYLMIAAWFIWGYNWQIILVMLILIPWWINKLIYRYSTYVATGFAKLSEANFVYLFKHGVVLIKMPDGSLLSSIDFIDLD